MEVPDHRLTLEEFLKLEAKSKEPLEYIDGYAVALAEATANHGDISENLSMTLGPIARSKGCRFYGGKAKVVGPDPKKHRAIPDFVITCDRRDLANIAAHPGKGEVILHHPWLVVEVISPKESAIVVARKFAGYQAIKEVQQYVQIDSQERKILVYERLPDGRLAAGEEVERIIFPHLGDFEMSIDDVYRDTYVPQLKAVRSSPKKGHIPRI
ncbi:MAG TPA: Uma2 family endonuclease [Candidatus Baltobacteraceae bacterium]|jgi:Uma2 family endonuclease|nr:Uma2 family endonuclease [Candidatus Baltobacteraceae bacterium]